MALIKCPECGREISDKAVSCPGCGYPIAGSLPEDNRSDLEKLVDEICSRNKNRAKAVKELREATGMDLKTAMDIMDKKYLGYTWEEKDRQLKEKDRQLKEKQRQTLQEFGEACERVQAAFGGSKVARCPKCHSTQITYGGNRVSLGRAAIGGAVAGGPGAVLGGMTGKKGYAVCLNCGKRWKI